MGKRVGRRTRPLSEAIPYIDGRPYKYANIERAQYEIIRLQGSVLPIQIGLTRKAKSEFNCNYCGGPIFEGDDICDATFTDGVSRNVHSRCSQKAYRDEANKESNRGQNTKTSTPELEGKIHIISIGDKEEILAFLEGINLEVIDNRPSGGALWVVGGQELSSIMEELKTREFRFSYTQRGGKASQHRPAWYYKE